MRGLLHLLGAGRLPVRALHAGGPDGGVSAGGHAHGALPRHDPRAGLRRHRPPHPRPPLRHHGRQHLPGARRHVPVPRQHALLEEPRQQGPPLPRLPRLRRRQRALHQRHHLRRAHRVHPQGGQAEQPAPAALPPGPRLQLQHRLLRHAHRQPAEPRHRRHQRHLLRLLPLRHLPGHDRWSHHQHLHPPLLLLEAPLRRQGAGPRVGWGPGRRCGRRRGHLAPVHAREDVARQLGKRRRRLHERADPQERQHEQEQELQLRGRPRHPGRHQVGARVQHVAGDGGGVHSVRPARRWPPEGDQDDQPPAQRDHRGRARAYLRRRREGEAARRGGGEAEEVEGARVEDRRVPHDARDARLAPHGAQHVLDRHHRRPRPPGARFHRRTSMPREGIVLAVDLLLRDVHNGGWLQQNWHTQRALGAGGAAREDRQRQRNRASCRCDSSSFKCCLKCSNSVLLLGTRVAASAGAISPASEKKAWLILAWVSTVAGNLTLLGSAANLIVCEQARRAQFHGYNLTFWSHLRFGVPSTIIVTAIGLIIVVSY
ncbi:unnamed protein product [Triticum turgidum subsp. durum]|uniref:Citrate transporter-like domain-containing protein n=1 Tax=Triticum turgidum subsp. durum TaxID=4567 RepID=A0A9R0Q4U6_TRITD|nr:unnamed protein product [Triticum turgidum subsp. durum]